jgi:DnaJ-class molecular chaperone
MKKMCKTCNGTGEVYYRNSDGEILYFIQEKDRCPDCNGTGEKN